MKGCPSQAEIPSRSFSWHPILDGKTKKGGPHLTLTHGLGGNPDNYVVDPQFISSTYPALGRNNLYYGKYSSAATGEERGAAWWVLTDQTITISRELYDEVA